jgi:hypothetical protein
MDIARTFPNDDIGRALQRMQESGDDLSKARKIDFCFAFQERAQALDFIRLVPDKTVKMSLSWAGPKSTWQVIVTLSMLPSHGGITAMESAMTKLAKQAGGSADGWDCPRVPSRDS